MFPSSSGSTALNNFGLRGIAKKEGDGKAFEANLTLGRIGAPGNWRFFYLFQYVEQDALIGAYNTDDWWFHTWYRGHRVGAGVHVPAERVRTGILHGPAATRSEHLAEPDPDRRREDVLG